jgi:hypothetical protein
LAEMPDPFFLAVLKRYGKPDQQSLLKSVVSPALAPHAQVLLKPRAHKPPMAVIYLVNGGFSQHSSVGS